MPSKSMILVDSLNAASIARAAGINGRFATDNPLLAEHHLLCPNAINIDSAIERNDEVKLGKFAAKCAIELDDILDCPEIAQLYGLKLGSIRCAANAIRLLNGQIYRAVALARVLREIEPDSIYIFGIDRAPSNNVATFLPERFQAPWSRLAYYGFFHPINSVTKSVDYQILSNVNDTRSKSFFQRISGLPISAIIGVLSSRRWFSRLTQHLGAKILIMYGDNELMRETLGYLALKGISCQTLLPSIDYRNGNHAKLAYSELLVSKLLSKHLSSKLDSLKEFTPSQISALTKLIIWHYSGGLFLSAQKIFALKKEFSVFTSGKFKPSGIVANAIVGIEGAHLHAFCREKNIPIFDFQHGVTTGLSLNSESKLTFSEVTNCDEMFVCSDAARISYESIGPVRGRLRVVGLADQVRTVRRRSFQRWLSRRSLHINAKTPVVMHVCTTSFHGNMRSGPHLFMEREVLSLNRQLICNVYSRLSGWKILFKDYPTQRFPFEPDCSHYAGTYPMISYLGDEDFRYIRSAADVIVTMAPTSTLGWCVGANTPLVWLDSKVMPLLHKDQTEAFRESFFFIDMDDNNWMENLEKLLAGGLSNIQNLWEAKTQARKECLKKYITGPANYPSGKLAASIILDTCFLK